MTNIKSFFKQYSFYLLFIAISFALVISPKLSEFNQETLNQAASKTIVSKLEIDFESDFDKQKTRRLLQQRKQLIQPIWSINEIKNKDMNADLLDLFNQIRAYKSQELLKNNLSFLSNRQAKILISLSASELTNLEKQSLQQLNLLLLDGISKSGLPKSYLSLNENLSFSLLPKEQQMIASRLIKNILKPNQMINNEKTQALIQKELNSIHKFSTQITKGEVIVQKGQPITNEIQQKLKVLNQYQWRYNTFFFLGVFSLITYMTLSFKTFIENYHRKLSLQEKLLIMSLVITLLLTSRFLQLSWPTMNMLYFVVPIPLYAFLISPLSSNKIALYTGMACVLLISLLLDTPFEILIYFLISHCFSCFIAKNLSSRLLIIKKGHVLGISLIFCSLSVGCLMGISDIKWYLSAICYAYLMGLFCSIITLSSLPYLESAFKLSSSMSLVEEFNLNHPLMKRLLVEAPGTYHHSLMVSNLAEAAAESVGANGLLCRIGGYFHDIGKLKRPTFFIENQDKIENPHESLNPKMSKIIIAAHTKDGLELAEKYKLPKQITQFIQQHHGTSLVTFFYFKAKEIVDETSKEDYRYEGPIPENKDVAILMLADAVEAATRQLKSPSPVKINQIITSIFEEKLLDQQLNNSQLTLTDLNKIKKSFCHILASASHRRIDYKESLLDIG